MAPPATAAPVWPQPTPEPTAWDIFLAAVSEVFYGSLLLLVLFGLYLGFRKIKRELEEEKKKAEEARKREADRQNKIAQEAKAREQQVLARQQAFHKACSAAGIDDFRVYDGRGKHRDTVIVEIDWHAAPGCKTTLHLWKSEHTFRSPSAVEHHDWRERASELDFEPDGRPLRFIDTEVDDGEPAHYYAWISIVEKTSVNPLSEKISFEKRRHVARFGETFADLAKRRMERLKHEQQLRAAEAGVKRKAEPPPMPPAKRELVDEALELAGSLLKAKKSTEQLYARLDAWCEAQDLSDEDAEVIKEEVLRQLDGKT